ncbi:MAG TPA: PAS domain-containing sensor histidine kinase [Nitrospirota bacterium]|nr:PAS domain-containing sensor histidine kinase [Nitrospirota bacterium]
MKNTHPNDTAGGPGDGKDNGLDWQAQYEAIFSNLPVGIAYLTTDMRFVRINPFLEKKLGRKSEEMAGRLCYETVGMYKDDPGRRGTEKVCDVCGVKSALQSGHPFKFTRAVREDFMVENIGVPLKDKDGRIIGAMEIILDITERLKMEERLQRHASELEALVEEKTRELHDSKLFLNNIIESTADAILTLDESGRVCYLNPAAEEILGCPAELLFERRLTDLVKEEDRQDLERALGQTGGLDETCHNLKVTVVTRDGQERHQMISVSPLSMGDEKNRFVVVCKDVSKERKLEREKEEFLAMLTHDMKTPLTSIIGYSTLLLDGEVGALGDEMHPPVEGIKVNAQKMLSMVRNFLSAGRMTEKLLEVKPKPQRLESLVLESLNNMKPQIKDKGLTTEVIFSPGLPHVSLDREHMERVFCNLVANAVKFTPHGGKLTVRVHGPEDGFVHLEITDTGMGISPEELPMLFDKYYQGKGSSVSRGTGLGLYIAKSIVEAHKGSIHVRSECGQGTTFTIRIPEISPAA